MKTTFSVNHSHSVLTKRVMIATMALGLVQLMFSSCEKFIDIDAPDTQIIKEAVYLDDASAESSVRGVYIEMATISAFSGGANSIALLAGTSSDELIDLSGEVERMQFFTNSLIPVNGMVINSLWGPMYKYVYYANSILEGLNGSSANVTPALKSQLEGEAKFIRAFSYFYLVNLFGDVPLITSTDYRINVAASRASITAVYDQIVADLKDAQNLLPEDYSHANGERIRPNKWAATALLARTYLYMEDWINAEIQSNLVIEQTSLYSLALDLNSVFLANSLEAIWQLLPVEPGYNTQEGNIFRPLPGGANNKTALTIELVNSFESGDERRNSWVDTLTFSNVLYYYPYKYKVQGFGNPLTEYSMVLRLAEQYLIRAEARANQEKLLESIEDVNVIRQRADLPLLEDIYPEINQSILLQIIEHERRVEFFSEWGHRWLDLKRTGHANNVLALIKTDWQPTDVLYPIPESERTNNFYLSQNDGY